MEAPESERLERTMEDSASTHQESGLGGSPASLHGVESPQEIESVASDATGSRRDLRTNSDEAERVSTQEVADVSPSSPTGETSGGEGVRVEDEDSNRLTDNSGAERAGNMDNLEEGDIGRKDDPTFNGSVEETGTAGVQYMSPAFVSATGTPADKSRGIHLIDIPLRERSKVEELDNYKGFAIARTASNFSVESGTGDQCRICQQHTDEPLMELGCHCRGELAKAHRSCVDHWFGNKGTNKCEVCQHVATNVPAPSSEPTPHFWVWRVGGPYNGAAARRAGGVGPLRLHPLPMRPVLLMTLKRHPTIMLLWLLLFAFMAYLFVDVTDSASIGYAAMPIGFLFGVLVVLGLGTAARLVLECWHERVIRRNIRRMEEEPNFEDFPATESNISILVDPIETQSSTANIPPQTADVQDTTGTPQVATTTATTA